jgi:phi LC3 family holin
MNVKIRFKNSVFVTAMVAAIIAFVYQILGICGIVPPVAQDTVSQLVGLVINILVSLGILVNPTTPGFKD